MSDRDMTRLDELARRFVYETTEPDVSTLSTLDLADQLIDLIRAVVRNEMAKGAEK